MGIKSFFLSTNCLLILTTLISCQPKDKQSTKDFACKQSYEDISTYLPINAIGDSVVICDKHKFQVDFGSKADSGTYVAVLTRHPFADNRIIWNCTTDTSLTFKYPDHTLTYTNKRLIVGSNKMFFYFGPKGKSVLSKQLPAYRQEVYAENGTLNITKAKMILIPLQYPASSVKFARAKYDSLAKTPNAKLNMSIAEDLFVAALSGDKLAKKRLLELKNKFVVAEDDKQILDDRLDFYQEYRSSKKAASLSSK
jgi:hypothetical protein